MKKFLSFLAIFVVILIAFYLEPVFAPPDLASPVEEQSPTLNNGQSLNYETIPAEGFSTYINRDVTELTEVFGAPIATQETGFGYTIATYNDQVRNIFIEANQKDGRVIAIKVAGASTDRIAPFHFGMDLTDLTSVTTLFSNFDLDYDGQPVSLELSEEDMNYRPLIAFDNDTFAILFFGQNNYQLYGVAYMNKEMLLQVMPYQWNSEPISGYRLDDLTEQEWEERNLANTARGISLINYLRHLENLGNYPIDGQFFNTANTFIQQVSSQPETMLSENALREWQEIVAEVPYMHQLSLTNADLLDQSAFENQWVMLNKPVTDVTFSVLNWYSDPYTYSHFTHDDESLAIAFYRENMVVLIQPEIETEVRDSSDY